MPRGAAVGPAAFTSAHAVDATPEGLHGGCVEGGPTVVDDVVAAVLGDGCAGRGWAVQQGLRPGRPTRTRASPSRNAGLLSSNRIELRKQYLDRKAHLRHELEAALLQGGHH